MASADILCFENIEEICKRFFDLANAGEPTKTKLDIGSFRIVNYTAESIADTPAGFLGSHKFLTVEVKLADGANVKVRLFVKCAPIGIPTQLQYIEEYGVFKKEILVYRQVLPRLEEIFPQVAPKCYFAENTTLVLENLAELGFRMCAERDGLLDYSHLNCMLKSLANLHAASLVFEIHSGKKIPEIFPEAIQENAYPLNITADHVRAKNFNNANAVFCEMIKTIPEYQSQLDFVLGEFSLKMRSVFEICRTSKKYRNVFSHGDLWANNMMFQKGRHGEVPLNCRFVDFQLARYAPPIVDVLSALTITTTSDFRARHLNELLDNYYRYLQEFLRLKNINLEQHISRDEFNASSDEFHIVGIIESLLFSHLTILPHELTQHLTGSAGGFSDFFDHQRIQICMSAFNNDSVYRGRMKEMICHLIENYILK